MINNKLKAAKFKLSQHRIQGAHSALSVFEVARLMDTVKNGAEGSDNYQSNLFFSMN
ncbi:MAG: hypothetical protein JKY09_07880 [Crocinitomicaceae bacterium]|nr:hypothetical protein [Crocinitomicaceae bacterium]